VETVLLLVISFSLFRVLFDSLPENQGRHKKFAQNGLYKGSSGDFSEEA
jgi:hypothetical protein